VGAVFNILMEKGPKYDYDNYYREKAVVEAMACFLICVDIKTNYELY
jgi:hypothetical protein